MRALERVGIDSIGKTQTGKREKKRQMNETRGTLGTRMDEKREKECERTRVEVDLGRGDTHKKRDTSEGEKEPATPGGIKNEVNRSTGTERRRVGCEMGRP